MINEGGTRDELALTQDEGNFLYALVKLIKPKVLFEIGTHKGVSSSYILQAMKENGFGHLWTTDPVDYGAAPKVIFEDRHWITFMDKMGKDVKLEEQMDFVFVDGFHTKEDVLPEIDNLLPQLAPNAVVIFHDAQDEKTNIEEGVNAALKIKKIPCSWLPSKHCFQLYQHNPVI